MTFDEILDQVIALLKRQGRVSYSALKIRFNLTDDYLEAFKTELIEAQHLAIDENGRVLVWIGDPHGTPVSAPQFGRGTQQPTVQPAQPRRDRPASSVLPPLDAERRQLTVMFCDLVDSTLLAEQLDPEDLREVVRAYQQTCAEVIQHFDGYVAQYLGDGLLVYFGFPSAHEDDPQRAVRAGLGILEAMQNLNRRLEQDIGVRLAIRLGIHTGLVVVGEMGTEGRHEHLALGDTPNIASRLQDLAIPNTVNISAATFHLVEGYFTCQDLGSYTLRGIETPKHALIQKAAYQSLLKRTQQQYQLRIAQVLAKRFPETAETQPELLAHHCTEAGLGEQAGYWQRAGQRALERSAYVEGISHLSMGLQLLKALPETTARLEQERTMQLALGRALLATKGYAAPEVGTAYTPVLFGLKISVAGDFMPELDLLPSLQPLLASPPLSPPQVKQCFRA